MTIEKLGVVGCGVMGSGIVQTCAQSGYEVTVLEADNKLLEKGLLAINLALTKSINVGRLSVKDKEIITGRISGTINVQDLNNCDLVIEAVGEDIQLKRRIFADLDRICPKHTILATNTSCLSVIAIAMASSRTERVVGLHFFNPAPTMKLLEIVRTIATSEEALEVSRRFGESLGKVVIIAQDSPGFIVNRLLLPFLLSAISMLEAGVAERETIDTAINLGLGHPMGPLTLADLIGLDVVLLIAEAIYEELKDPRYVPPVLLKRMVTAGWLGRKTGRGFYDYPHS